MFTLSLRQQVFPYAVRLQAVGAIQLTEDSLRFFRLRVDRKRNMI